MYFCCLSHTGRPVVLFLTGPYDHMTSEATLHFDLVKIALVAKMRWPFSLADLAHLYLHLVIKAQVKAGTTSTSLNSHLFSSS